MNPILSLDLETTEDLLKKGDYVADRQLVISLFLCLKLGRPLFLEGEAGVGKTEIAKVLSSVLGLNLIRLQCYEGLDVGSAVYEWNYARQMMAIRLAESEGALNADSLERDIYSQDYLIERPLLAALRPEQSGSSVLLIDEIDRADQPFEAFLLETLSDYQVTIPEIGTIKASQPPVVIITSNRTREVHDALKRRCLYHWVDYPSAEREHQIIRVKLPDASKLLSQQVVQATKHLRSQSLFKPPGVAETLDWTRALMALDKTELDKTTLADTLGVVLKYQDDLAQIRDQCLDSTLSAAHSL